MAQILIVDDEPTIRRLVRLSLEAHGHSVIEAPNGALGLTLAKLERPDLILLDIALPQMSGLEVARHLQEDVHVSSTPILFLTGLVPETEHLETSDSASQYIAKPFSPDLLVERVASALPGLSVAS